MTIKINGMITNNDDAPIYRDWLGMDVVSPSDVEDGLKSAGGKNVTVEINSLGGEVDAAAQIYTTLKDYVGTVTTQISSSAYSAGSIIAMAGDVVRISPAAQIMIHNASVGAEGDVHTMNKAVGMLESTNKTIANVYAEKTGKDVDYFLNLMDKETWMSPEDAKEIGLVDEIIDYSKATVTNSATLVPHMAMDKIKNLLSENKKLKNNQKDSQLDARDQLVQDKLAIFYEEE